MKQEDQAAPTAMEQQSETETSTQQAPAPAARRRAKKTKAPDADGVDFTDATKYGTTEQLVAAYNEMAATAVDLGMKNVGTVQMFVDTRVGAKACERLHTAIIKARIKAAKAQHKEESKTMSRKTKTTGTTRRAASKTTTKRAANGSARAKRFDGESKITIVADENPKRKGTEQFNRFAKLAKAHGKKVGDYLKNGESTTLRHAVEIGYAKVS